MSEERSMRPRPSRSHWTAAPPTNTLPSSAYSIGPSGPIRHAAVVRSLCLEATGLPPVCIRRKQPVPYVFLAIPGRKHACPKRAACWSPAIPAIGVPRRAGIAVTSPSTSLLARMAGSTSLGIRSALSRASSQSPARRLNNRVLEAFETSVACTCPSVRFHRSQVSTVPKASSPRPALRRAPGMLSRSQASLVPLK